MIYKNYDVYEDGMIVNKRSGKEVKCVKKSNGYMQVTLYNDTVETWLVHRLLAKLFIPNPDNKPCVEHINADRSDNRLCNIRWATYTENNNNPITLERKSKSLTGKQRRRGYHQSDEWKKKIAIANSTPIIQYNDNGYEKEWSGINEASRVLGYSAGNISACCRGVRQTHKGFKWRFK